ncbi:hypothetical protein B0A69_11445 [Chryseobacterium shigense]|nr:hypothetical protein B0A69_11445 [Chryseobacterium shigense]
MKLIPPLLPFINKIINFFASKKTYLLYLYNLREHVTITFPGYLSSINNHETSDLIWGFFFKKMLFIVLKFI